MPPGSHCTICGTKVVLAGGQLLHQENGATAYWRRSPGPHPATIQPKFLVLWLRWR